MTNTTRDVHNMRHAMTFNKIDDVARHDVVDYRIVYVSRFNETRTISHLSCIDACIRANAMRARGYRVTIERMFNVGTMS
jgi:hypothetical protein